MAGRSAAVLGRISKVGGGIGGLSETWREFIIIGFGDGRLPSRRIYGTEVFDLLALSVSWCGGCFHNSRKQHGRDPTCTRGREEASVLQHRRHRLADSPRRPIHRAR